jgi:hypothetical protein
LNDSRIKIKVCFFFKNRILRNILICTWIVDQTNLMILSLLVHLMGNQR